MHKAFPLFFLLTILFACSSEEKFDPLNEPPYDKITDSIRKEPKNAELYYRRGSLLFNNNQPVFAAKDVRNAWQLSPKEEYALRLVSIYKKINADSAIGFINEALKQLPNSIGLRIYLAKGYQSKGNIREANKIVDELIATYPGELNGLSLKAELLKGEGKTKEAIAVLEKAYFYAPDDIDLVYTLAFDYAEEKNPKALKLADSLIALDPEKRHAEPFYLKGLYYANTGQSNKAIQQFDSAIVRDINFMDAYINKGIVYFDRKDYTKALLTFQKTVEIEAQYAEGYYWIGKTYEAQGKKDQAKENYLLAYQFDKTMARAKQAADRL
jgi:tetratricopeptide (TPR) repeat protein